MLVENSHMHYAYCRTNLEPLLEIVDRSNRPVMGFQYCQYLHPMQQMLAQEIIYLVYNIVRNIRNETDMFYPEFTSIGYRLWQGAFLAQIWECHIANIFP